MNLIIRKEIDSDYKLTENLVEEAFKNAEFSDHSEHFLVSRLRKSDAFIPELSIVACDNSKVIGHILFTKIFINNGSSNTLSLGLAPLSVLPKYQGIGIGSKLIEEGLNVAKSLGFKSVIVLGHDKYYPRFGFKKASLFNIKAPFDVPSEAFMALELEEGSLKNISGTVIYNKAFFE